MNMEVITQLLYVHLWQGLLLVPVIWVITRFFVKKDAALRHGLWFSALCLLVILPFTTFIDLPRLTTQWFQMDAAIEIVDDVSFSKIPDAIIVSVEQKDAVMLRTSSAKASINLFLYAALFVWFVGFCLKFANIFQELIYCLKFKTKTKLTPISGEFLPNRWPLEINVFLDDNIITPMMVGFFKPRILIPTHFTKSMPCDQIISILFHELAHIERRDQWTSFIQQILLSVMWWSPFAHIATKRILIDRELACDDSAAYRSGSANSYATALIEGSKQVVMSKTIMVEPQLALGIFHRPSELKERITRLLETDYSQGYIMKKNFSAFTIVTLMTSIFAISFATPGLSSDSDNSNSVSSFRLNDDPLQRAFVEESMRTTPETLARFLENGADINGVAKGDGTALMMAVRGGRMDNVEFLINQGADVNISAKGDGNPLIMAVRRGDKNMIDYLLRNGANLDAVAPGDGTALIAAVREGIAENVDLLIQHGADVNAHALHDGNPLIVAASRNNLPLIQKLLAHGANIDAIVTYDETALITAVRSNNFDAVHALAEAGANLSLGAIAPGQGKNNEDICRTPLGEAKLKRNRRIIDYLEEHGAQIIDCAA